MNPYKTVSCPSCHENFDLAHLAENREVEPIGMQFEDTDQHYNYYHFNHVCDRCGTTFLLPVLEFLPLIQEPVPNLVLAGTEDCERHCYDIKDLRTCDQPCMYAPFRRHLLTMRTEHETSVATPAPGQDAVKKPAA
jgi:hypothetical protein